MATATPTSSCVVRVVPVEELRRALDAEGALFSLPAWAASDPGWSPLALAWVDPLGRPVAGVLVLCRRVPGSARFLAVLAGAPVPAERCDELPLWLPAATALLRRRGAFAVRGGLSRC